MFKKVFLIRAGSQSFASETLTPPVGLGYIAQILELNNISYDVLDMNFGYSYGFLKKRLENYNPDLIGMGMGSALYDKNFRLISRIKRDFPKAKIVVGGWHASVCKEKVLEESAADFCIYGEAEHTIVSLCNNDDLMSIAGLIHRNNNNIISNDNRDCEKNLDVFPFPTYDKFEIEKYSNKREIGIITSRGCPYACTFCSAKIISGRKYRYRSAHNVIQEIDYWTKKKFKLIGILDDSFTSNKDRANQIFTELENRLRCFDNEDLWSISFPNGVRADTLDDSMLKRMKRTGVKHLGIGVESANNEILKKMKKSETIETIEKAIENAVSNDMKVTLFFLIGMPGETLIQLNNSINLALKYPVTNIYFNHPIPFPGTELYNYLTENNLLKIGHKKYLNSSKYYGNKPVFETHEMSFKERIKAEKLFKAARNEIHLRLFKQEIGSKSRLKKSLFFFYLFIGRYFINLRTAGNFIVRLKSLIGKSSNYSAR